MKQVLYAREKDRIAHTDNATWSIIWEGLDEAYYKESSY